MPNAVEQTKATAMAKAKPVSLEETIRRSVDQLQVALPQGMSAERMARIALTCLRINPKLFEVAGRNPQSFIAALFQSAQLGLEPNTIGEAWLIAYGNEVKFQIGAYGWAKLFYNNQSSTTLQMEKVHQNDFFEYDLGSQTISHRPPKFGEDRGPVAGYYAVANITGGGKIIKTMSVQEARDWAIRYSKCWNKDKEQFIPGTPWASHFDSMAQVTVLKQVLKIVPKSAEMIKKAFAMDESVKSKVEPDMASVPNEIDYSVQAEKAEEVKAEVEPPSEPPPQGDPPLAVDAEVSKKQFEIFRLKIATALTRAEVNTIYKAVEKDVEEKKVSEDHMRQLLELMKKRTQEIKKPKE